MKNKFKKILVVFLILILIVVCTIIAIFYMNKYKEQQNINYAYEVFDYDHVQDRIEDIKTTEDLSININGCNKFRYTCQRYRTF